MLFSPANKPCRDKNGRSLAKFSSKTSAAAARRSLYKPTKVSVLAQCQMRSISYSLGCEVLVPYHNITFKGVVFLMNLSHGVKKHAPQNTSILK